MLNKYDENSLIFIHATCGCNLKIVIQVSKVTAWKKNWDF